MAIRPEKLEDKSQIATLIARTYAPEGAKIIEKVGGLRALESYNNKLSLVEEVGGAITAFALFTPVRVGHGKAVYLAPLAFDSTVDVATFLIQSFEKAQAENYRYVFLEAQLEDVEALGFVQASSLGFVPHSEYLMVKDLGEGEALSGNLDLPEILL